MDWTKKQKEEAPDTDADGLLPAGPAPQEDPVATVAAAVRNTVTVTLIGPLVHAGVPCVAGDKIEVLPRQVEWLRAQGVI